MLDAQCVRVADREAYLVQDAGALAELERRPDAAQLEPFDVLHDQHGRVRLRPELEQPHDAAIGEEREGTRFAEECADAGGQRGVRAKHLGGDDAVETQVAKLEDFAHAAGADALDGVEPLEDRQALRRRGARTLGGRIPVEVPSQRGVLGDQPRSGSINSARPSQSAAASSVRPCSTCSSMYRSISDCSSAVTVTSSSGRQGAGSVR